MNEDIIKLTMPSKPLAISNILNCKCSGAEDIPKGSRLKQNQPNGVMNMVSKADSLANGICQKPELALSLVKTWAPESWASICSQQVEGVILCVHSHWVSLNPCRYELLHLVWSHYRPSHQSVGSSTLAFVTGLPSSWALSLGVRWSFPASRAPGRFDSLDTLGL